MTLTGIERGTWSAGRKKAAVARPQRRAAIERMLELARRSA
jgi:hypothetical protein